MVYLSSFLLRTGIAWANNLRIYLPRRVLSVTNCGSFGSDDYFELGSRFKAAHIRVMVWWVAYKVQQLTKKSESWFWISLYDLYSKNFYPGIGNGPHTAFTSCPTAMSSLQGRSCLATPASVQPRLGQSARTDGQCRLGFEPGGGKRPLFCMSFMYQRSLKVSDFQGGDSKISHEVDGIHVLALKIYLLMLKTISINDPLRTKHLT